MPTVSSQWRKTSSLFFLENTMKQLAAKYADTYQESRTHYSYNKSWKNNTVAYFVAKKEKIGSGTTDASIPHGENPQGSTPGLTLGRKTSSESHLRDDGLIFEPPKLLDVGCSSP